MLICSLELSLWCDFEKGLGGGRLWWAARQHHRTDLNGSNGGGVERQIQERLEVGGRRKESQMSPTVPGWVLK